MSKVLRSIAVPVIIALTATCALAEQTTDEMVQQVQRDWAIIKYQTDEDQQADAYKALVDQVTELVKTHPRNAELLAWEAIVRSSYAGALGGIKSITTALPQVRKARDLLLEAEKLDPTALDGSIYSSLGALHYQVPGWPIGFGDKKKAREYLVKALSISPDNIDANYFYGDFLMERHDYKGAVAALEHALAAPPRPGRRIADEGRRKEIREALAKARSKASG